MTGQPAVTINRGLAKVLYGKKVTYTGAKRVESGLPLAPHLKAFTVKVESGAISVCVATGEYTVDQLREAGADHVLETFAAAPFPALG